MRQKLRQRYLQQLQQQITPLTSEALAQPTIIFAPHPDDETLGCGGTILQKRAIGAAVTIVFMTNGRFSHPHLAHRLPPKQLISIRRQEALAAAHVLGVPETNIHFLAFEDTQLWQHTQTAVEQVNYLLQNNPATEIFLPYQNDPIPDHLATYHIITTAAQQQSRPLTLNEYPIWFWHQWPYTNPLGNIRITSRRRTWLNLFKFQFGRRLLADFKQGVPITEQASQKKEALNQHKTQMTQYIDDPTWLTLNHVADGEFLDCFFQPIEPFKRTILDTPQHAHLAN